MKELKNILSFYRVFSVVLVFGLTPVMLVGQVSFYASSFSDKISVDEIFEVRFTIENSEVKDFTPPLFNGFELISGPSTASETSIINGVSKSKTTLIYTLKPLKAGTLTIGPAKIKTGKKELKSNSLTFNVLKASKKEIKNLKKNDNFFVRAELSDYSAVSGQQLMLTYKLYTTVKIAGIRNDYEPDLKGFQTQVIEYEFPVQNETINNRNFLVYNIKNIVLFPLHTGVISISPAKFIIEIPDERSNDVFFQTTRAFHVQTDAIKLDVKELPGNAPEFFKGHIGSVKITARLSSPVQSVDEAFSLVLDMESEANHNTLVAPPINEFLNDFEVYEPKLISENIGIESGRLISRKSFEYAIIPKIAGKQTIKIPYAYFDPVQKKYITEYTEPISIDVAQKSVDNVTKKSSGSEIFPSKPVGKLKKAGKPFLGSLVYFVILGLIIITLPVLYYIRFVHLANKKENSYLLADKEVTKQLKTARFYLEKGEDKKFFRETYDVLLNYVGEKSGIPAIERNMDMVIKRLKESGLTDDIVAEYSELLKICEEVLFAGKTDYEMNKIFTIAGRIISVIMSEFKKM